MSHTKFAFVFILLAALAAGLVERQANGQIASQRKARVAVLDFDYGTVQTESAAMFGTNVDIGKGITNVLITNLVKNGTYSIIERAALDKVLAEQNFSNSNRADATSAARLGKILGADYVILGTITEFGKEKKTQNVGGGGGNWRGLGVGGIGRSNSQANVGITARVINIDTAEILAAAEGKGNSSRGGLSLLGGGGNWHGFGGGNVDFGSHDFLSTIIGEATKKAVDQLTADLVANSPRLPVRTFKAEGIVASVEGGQIVLNVGSRAGVHAGDRLEVTRTGKEIKDPSTGQVIRRLTSTIGTIQATDVDETSALCTPVSGAGFNVGDRVSFTTTNSPSGGPEPSYAPASAAGAAPPNPAPASKGAPMGAGDAPSGQPDLKALKADFIPGDKVIFMDDFSDMEGDEPPPHWKVRGGTAELRTGGDIRQLSIRARSAFLTPNLSTVPPNFTLEGDIFFSAHWEYVEWTFADKKGAKALVINLRRNYTKLSVNINARGDKDLEKLLSEQFPTDFSQPVKQQVWCQNGRVRVYINGKRIVDVNQINLPPMDAPKLEIGNAENAEFVGLRNIRIAESTPDFGQVIKSTGRFVTHGILFDTNSDRIKPESAPVIQSIARGLEANPDLKLEIGGHTDSTGSADHNMDLSRRRAEAVKSILVSQFSLDEARLTTAGFGSSKPVDDNGTPQGKANNRRVEFVRK